MYDILTFFFNYEGGARVAKNKDGVIKSIIRVAPYLRPYRLKLAIIIVGTVLFALIRLVDPYLYKKLVDEVLVGGVSGRIGLNMALLGAAKICGLILLLRVGTSLIFSFYSYLSLEIVSLVEAKMFRNSLSQLQSLDMSFHNSKNSGEILSRVDRGIESLNRILHENIAKFFLPGIVNIICLVAWITYQNKWLALASVFFMPLHIYFSLKKAGPIYLNQSKINRLYERVYHRAYEGIYNIGAVISFNAAQHELSLFDKDSEVALKLKLAIARWWRVLGFSASFFEVLGRISVIMLGTYLVAKRMTTVGEIVMFLAYISMIYQPLLDMITMYLMMQLELSKAKRFTDLMEIRPRIIEAVSPVKLSSVKKGIKFKDVCFRYEEFEIPDSIESSDDGYSKTSRLEGDSSEHILEDIDMFIPAGSRVAFVGPTGSGKSTMANLIHRYYDPTAGTITIDGVDLRNIESCRLHELITVVPQHALLFSRTIKENIAYGKEDATDEEIMRAATIANAHDFIVKKPKGYETLIGERGIRLSGGEQQRISIARAVLQKASVIIMDEATSHLDSLSEALVQEALWKLIEGKTAIIIAHRLSTIVGADMIVVLNKGSIVDHGTNQELLGRCKLYQELYKKQFKMPAELVV